MSFKPISDTHRVARKPHQCIWCGETILERTVYVDTRSTYCGDFQIQRWHEVCLAWAGEHHFPLEVEFDPYENKRPREGTKQ